jgi:hypothetical protein
MANQTRNCWQSNNFIVVFPHLLTFFLFKFRLASSIDAKKAGDWSKKGVENDVEDGFVSFFFLFCQISSY